MTDANVNTTAPNGVPDRDDDDRRGRPLAWIILALGLLALGFLAFQALRAFGPAGQTGEASAPSLPPLVEVVTAAPQGRDYAIEADGFLRPIAEVGLAAEQPGRIAYVADELSPGARFEEGAVLIRLDDREAQAELARAEAEREAARAALSRSEADEGRQRRLAEIGAAAASRAEQATAELASADARLRQAEAALSVARERLEDTVLTAPFPATVLSEDASLGAYVQPGQVLARVFDNTVAELRIGVQPEEAAGIARAQAANEAPLRAVLRPTQGSATTVALTGRIASVGTALDQDARTVPITIRVPGAFDERSGGVVFANDVLTAVIPARAPDPLFAAPSGVLRRQAFVWTVREGRLVRVPVDPLSEEEGRVTFSAEADLAGEPLLLTALSEEAEGTRVRIRRADDRLAVEAEVTEGATQTTVQGTAQ